MSNWFDDKVTNEIYDQAMKRVAECLIWKAYAAAAMTGVATGWGDSASHTKHAAEIAAMMADALLDEHRKRWNDVK